MQPERLEIAETLRILWEQAEALDVHARHLGEAATRLAHAVRHAAAGHVSEQPIDLQGLLRATGAASELIRLINATDEALTDACRELPVVLEPDPPTALAARATAALRTRVTLRA